MLPYIELFGRSIPSYSLTAAAGLFAAVFYMKRSVRRPDLRDLDRSLEYSLIFALAGTAAGAKLLYLLISAGDIAKDLRTYGAAETLYGYLKGGFVFYGGLAGCFAGMYIYCMIGRISYLHLLQLTAPAFPLAHSISRCGCFLAGCCYGKETASHFSVVYSDSPFAPNGTPLVPVQLMEAACEMLIFILLYFDSRKGRPGDLILAKYLILYGSVRFILELFRGDEYRGVIGALSVSQFISLICVTAAAILIILRKAAPHEGEIRSLH